jgi:Protein of unknown function (DUF3078)
MKTKVFLLAATLFAATTLNAQTSDEAKKAADEAAANLTKSKADMKEGWTKGGTVNFSITQGGQNKYWTAVKGGNSLAFGAKGIIDYNFDQKKGKTTWLNSFRARYGGVTTSTYDPITDATFTIPFTKNDDYLNFNSTYGKEFRKNWSYAVFFGLESQFEDAFMSPGYIKFGPGFLYKPNAHFSMLMSPLMAQVTTKLKSSLKDVKAFGVDAGKSVAFGLGAFVQANANYDLAKGVNYKSTTTLYSNYLNNPGNIIFDMNNLFTFTVNKYIGATLIVNARYNHEEIIHLQVQQSIGVGLSYKL